MYEDVGSKIIEAKCSALDSALSMQKSMMGKRFVYVSDLEELKRRIARGEVK